MKRYTDAEIAQRQRQKWLLVKARGKARFVWMQGILPVLLIWVFVLPSVELFMSRGSPFSWGGLVYGVVTLPIFLLGGYLEGIWKWKDLEKSSSVGL